MMCTAVFLGCMATETDPPFVLNNIDAGFYLSGYVNFHSKIYQFAANHRFTHKAPILFRKVCLWSAIRVTSLSPFLLLLLTYRHHFLISCQVATKSVSVVSSTMQQPTDQTATSVV
jgi:hypothetical protein